MFFRFDEIGRIQSQQFAKGRQKLGRTFHSDRGLQIWLAQYFAQATPKFAVHADIDICIHQMAHFGNMGT